MTRSRNAVTSVFGTNRTAHLFKKTINNANALTDNYGNADTIDISEGMDNIMGSLAKFGYMPGSDIDIIISTTLACYILKDRELNKQFLDKDGNIDIFKLRAIFPLAGTIGGNNGYYNIFSKEEYVEIVDKTGRNHVVLNACKQKLPKHPDDIKKLQSGTADDLVRIGEDLEVVSTVISELEIDAAKDDSKREGMISITDFMNTGFRQRSRNLIFENNFHEMIEYEKGNSAAKITQLKYGFKEVKTLAKFDEYYAAEEKAYIDHLKETGEYSVIDPNKLKQELYKLKVQVRNECVIEDPLFAIVKEMMDVVQPTLKDLANLYVGSDMNIFKIKVLPQRNEEENWMEHESLEESIMMVKKTAVIIYEMINHAFVYGKHMILAKAADIAKVGRNIIYNAGAVRGFSAHDTFLMAVDAGWYRRNSKGNIQNTCNTPKENFKYAAVEAVFGTELKHFLNPDAMKKVADLEIPPEVLEAGIFEPGKALAFKNGQCTVPVDGENHTIIRLDETDFTGYLLLSVNEEEGYAEFIERSRQYDYEEMDYIIFDSIANVRSEHNPIAPEDFEAILVDAETNRFAMSTKYKASQLVLKTKSDKDGEMFLNDEEQIREAARISPLIEVWQNMVKSEYVRGLNSGIEQNHYYLSDSTGKGRILGKVHDSFLEEDKEYNNIVTIATAVGTIMIKSVQ